MSSTDEYLYDNAGDLIVTIPTQFNEFPWPKLLPQHHAKFLMYHIVHSLPLEYVLLVCLVCICNKTIDQILCI